MPDPQPISAAAPPRDGDPPAHLDERTLREFIHELANLVDGSMRSVELVRRELHAQEVKRVSESAEHRLETAIAGLAHVAGLVRSVAGHLQGLNVFARPGLLDEPRPLHVALAHAIDMLEPLAQSRRIGIDLEHDLGLDAHAPSALYPVIANALRNSIDAINSDGQILVRTEDQDGELVLEVLDDGPGPPCFENGRSPFDFGFSTKPGSSGIGLALARDLVTDLGGTINLDVRWADRPERRGAILSVRIPLGDHAR